MVGTATNQVSLSWEHFSLVWNYYCSQYGPSVRRPSCVQVSSILVFISNFTRPWSDLSSSHVGQLCSFTACNESWQKNAHRFKLDKNFGVWLPHALVCRTLQTWTKQGPPSAPLLLWAPPPPANHTAAAWLGICGQTKQAHVSVLGRPEKLPDVCYSWWVLASLKIIGRLHWIDKVNTQHSFRKTNWEFNEGRTNNYSLNIFWQEKLIRFILAAQDEETGGFADRPGNMVSISCCSCLCCGANNQTPGSTNSPTPYLSLFCPLAFRQGPTPPPLPVCSIALHTISRPHCRREWSSISLFKTNLSDPSPPFWNWLEFTWARPPHCKRPFT